jgi:hypothetical protein
MNLPMLAFIAYGFSWTEGPVSVSRAELIVNAFTLLFISMLAFVVPSTGGATALGAAPGLPRQRAQERDGAHHNRDAVRVLIDAHDEQLRVI